MKELNIFNVEKLIFQNNFIKNELNEFENFFKEYSFLKFTGVDKSLLIKLYSSFLKKISQSKTARCVLEKHNLYTKLFRKPFFFDFEINFCVKKNHEELYPYYISTNINNKLIINNLHTPDGKTSNILVRTSTQNPKDLFNFYKNFTVTRKKDSCQILFWK